MGPTVTEQQGNDLCRPVTSQEVRNAIFDISSTKSPGLDGFSVGFYKAAWSVIGNDICLAIQNFFSSGKLLKEVNTTLISLIPKVDCPQGVSDYRPIACCNVLFKAITKILTNRLQTVLPSTIDDVQGAFIKQRSIIDNILVCQGLVRNYNRDKAPPRCLIKMDIKKAYDTIEWSFIEEVLRGLRFPNQFIEWIMVCISTPKFTLLFNGHTLGFFLKQ